jgi:signal peptidase I
MGCRRRHSGPPAAVANNPGSSYDRSRVVIGRSAYFASVVGDALARGMVVRFRAEGESMCPTIRDGDRITVAPVTADAVVPGDVLLCRHGHRVLAHRLVAVTREGDDRSFHLRGDAKRGPDAPVHAPDIVGRVISVARRTREIRLCGRWARLRRAARIAASRAKALLRYQPVVGC